MGHNYTKITKSQKYFIYLVKDYFYLAIPGRRQNPSLKVIIDKKTLNQEELILLVDTKDTQILILPIVAKETLDNLDNNDLMTNMMVNNLIARSIEDAKGVLTEYKVNFTPTSTLETGYTGFNNWYQGQNALREEESKMEVPVAPVEEPEKESNPILDELKEFQQQLLIANSQTNQKLLSDGGTEKGPTKLLTTNKNGHASFNDGFVNVVMLSIISFLVTVGTILAVIYTRY